MHQTVLARAAGPRAAAAPSAPPRSRGALRVVAAKAKGRPTKTGGAGFVSEDNSGRSNIFAVEPRTLYTKSPTSERAAQAGLGGQQGLALAGGLIALVLLVTLGVAKTDPGSLASAQKGPEQSLSALAARMQ